MPEPSAMVMAFVPKGTVLHWNGIPVEAMADTKVLANEANLPLIESAGDGRFIEYGKHIMSQE